MRKNIIFTVGLLAAFLLVQSSFCMAGLFDLKKSVEGNITQMQANLISLQSKVKTNGGMEQEEAVDITVNEDTKFVGIALTELRKGDPVRVEYKEERGMKVAVQVEKTDNASEKTKKRG